MEDKQTLSRVALLVSIFPMTALIPSWLHINVSNGINSVWAGVNVICVLLGFILSIICIKGREKSSLISIISTIISSIWILLMAGIFVLAMIINL